MHFTPKQQAFLNQFQILEIIAGDIPATYEQIEVIHEASESCFSFEQWEEFCSYYAWC